MEKTSKIQVNDNMPQAEPEFKIPTEIVDLPSRGLIYPKDNILSSGEIEMRYPTTNEEDILNSKKLISNGTVIDTFLKSLLNKDVNFGSLDMGDKSALIIASRILLWGAEYKAETTCKHCQSTQQATFDLTQIKDLDVNFDKLNRENVYQFTLPKAKHEITFKLLTNSDEVNIANRIKSQKAISKKLNRKTDIDKSFTARLKQMIISIDDITDERKINQFIDAGRILTTDSMAFKNYLATIQPGIDRSTSFVCDECGEDNHIKLPMTLSFFWPASDLA